MCFWKHNWRKWTKPEVIDGIDGKKYVIQTRTCDRCGKWQRQVRHDT